MAYAQTPVEARLRKNYAWRIRVERRSHDPRKARAPYWIGGFEACATSAHGRADAKARVLYNLGFTILAGWSPNWDTAYVRHVSLEEARADFTREQSKAQDRKRAREAMNGETESARVQALRRMAAQKASPHEAANAREALKRMGF